MPDLSLYKIDSQTPLELPYADEGVRAGFPSPGQDYTDNSIDLNRDLVSRPESTFYARVGGDSMIDAGIHEGDIIIVDKSIDVNSGDIAVCAVNGEFTVKYVDIHADHIVLRPANKSFPPLRVDESDAFEVWGAVTYVIHKLRKTL